MPREATSSSGQPEPATTPRLRDRLRLETRAEHEALDAGFDGMLAPGAEALYACFLLTNRAGHEAVEPLLRQSPLARSNPAAWEPGGRLAALAADCRDLALPRFAAPARLPLSPSLPEALGAAYVLEGSRLGAAFLLKALRRSPGSRLPVRYLLASSDPEPFRRLLAVMSAAGLSEREADRAVAAANQTFRTFRALAEGARIRMTFS
ncbi:MULTISPECIES: biliverdin-producing heme oxygenase [unclassified Aureimonas]|uniref:biliverdin-producing heme oxygenase n=1 Tax=unclassified Aureimonas TaxID=2615206 RepID=UPI000721FB56|nr:MULTISPECIES: biliverdin-producing heme oxygenase [unclassified Aureimonas]ALN72318.1 hypothetical protein M673_06300 [Aureimonas sp. AU20]